MTTVMHTIGRGIGKTAAYACEGTRLASISLVQGAKEGYAEKTAELKAQRLALAAPPAAAARQHKLATTS